MDVRTLTNLALKLAGLEKTITTALMACLAASSWAADTQKFSPIDPAMLDGHPPIFISWDSVQREGPAVSLTYLLETPTGSNSIDVTIDCGARTVVTRGVRVHPETLPPGAVRSIPPEPPRPIGKKSTWDVLAKAVCK
jgi:hypothetical protein